MDKITSKKVLKICLIYGSKVWLANTFLLLLLEYEFGGYHKFSDFTVVKALPYFISYASINAAFLGFITYRIIADNTNHFVKKIVLGLLSLVFIWISILIFLGSDFAIYIALAVSIPTFIGIGLFYPDDLDEQIKK